MTFLIKKQNFCFTKFLKNSILFVLILAFSSKSLSQTNTNNLFFKQDPIFRGLLTLKDFNLKGKVKIVENRNYTYNKKTGKQDKRRYCNINYFSKQGILIKKISFYTVY